MLGMCVKPDKKDCAACMHRCRSLCTLQSVVDTPANAIYSLALLPFFFFPFLPFKDTLLMSPEVGSFQLQDSDVWLLAAVALVAVLIALPQVEVGIEGPGGSCRRWSPGSHFGSSTTQLYALLRAQKDKAE